MRFALAACALALSAAATADAFVPSVHRPNRRVRVKPVLVGGLGWDNDKFLSSLSGNDKDREEANDRYFRMSRFGRSIDRSDDDDDETPPAGITSNKDDLPETIPGAMFTKDMVEKIKQSHTPEEEASGGGRMFREMIARAKKSLGDTFDDSYSQQQQPMDPNNLSVEDQARMFREMMMQQQNSAYPPDAMDNAYPEPPPRPANMMRGGVDAQGRKIGRNRDADAITNTADVYFAQLKRDSTVRNIARMQGDYERAEAVFADPYIKSIKPQVNPYLEEQKQKERDMFTTSAEEMITPEMFIEREKKPASYSGVSYKDKLQQIKLQKSRQATPAAAAVPPETKPVEPTKANETWAQKLSIEEEQKVVPQPVSRPEAYTPPRPTPTPRAPPAPVAPPVAVTPPAPVAAPVINEPRTEESTKRDIRTLMGLLLKHRGGSGFGAGRLQGQEADKLEILAADLVTFLKEEALPYPQESFAKRQDLTVGEKVPERSLSTPGARPSPPAEQSPIVQPPQAVVSYNPPQQQQQQQQQRGGAMEQAIKTPSAERIGGVLSCIDGAIQMYRNAPPELEEAVLITLRAALLSAVNSVNAIIAENEVKNLEAYRTATTDPRTRTRVQAAVASAFSSSSAANKEAVFDVIPEQEMVTTPTPAATLGTKDENSQFYEQVLEKLRAASGTGKMGLRNDLSQEEAAELADAVARMRSMLIQELD